MALQRFVTESGAGLQGGCSVTVATLLETFMNTATLSPTTRQDWVSVIHRHLIPELGTIPLWKISARDCDHMYQRLAHRGLSPARVRNTHVVLHRTVAQAVRWGWLTRNPVSNATRPEVPRSTVTPPNRPGPPPPHTRRANRPGPVVLARHRDRYRCPTRRDLRAAMERHRPHPSNRPNRTIRLSHQGTRRVLQDHQDRPLPAGVTHHPSRPLPHRTSRQRRSECRRRWARFHDRSTRVHQRSRRPDPMATRTSHPAMGTPPNQSWASSHQTSRAPPLRRHRTPHRRHRPTNRLQPTRARAHLNHTRHLLGMGASPRSSSCSTPRRHPQQSDSKQHRLSNALTTRPSDTFAVSRRPLQP
jgi:hypothetical protein